MTDSSTAVLYGRHIELEPLDPGDEIDQVIVLVKTRAQADPVVSVSANPETGEPPRMSSELKYLIDLGVDPDFIARRAKLAGPNAVLRATKGQD